MDREQPDSLAPTGNVSFVKLPRRWFIACRSDELRATPIARVVQGVPLAIARLDGKPAAFADRCPHRNAPLSIGRVKGAALECPYHGWQFDGVGQCLAIPGLCAADVDAKARRATSFAAREQDGYVWVYSSPDETPAREPYAFAHLRDAGYATVRREFTVKATMHATAENALDVPHTAFLHGGLFRTARKENEIDVVVRRTTEMVEAEYLGEPRPPGLAARILAPGGGVVTHFDRFLLPSIAQVEYRLGEDSHLLITSAMTPVTETETRLYAVVTFRTPLPAAILKLVLMPVALRIFRQDAVILSQQTETIRRFGGERFANTEIDVLGQQMWRLLKQAERGDGAPGGEPEIVERLRMRV
ncbi:MAG TPA: aromatic ring-hydroxylating dioxygenase subunit alpha [bacterium]|nr:aromatic ring-hydroxylating dioxygenase subunit alpha [bacterium]